MQNEEKKQCGARTKSGNPCGNYSIQGRERCRMHGGKQKRGTAHHLFKHGLYSKFVSNDLQQILEELDNIDQDDLIDPINEIKIFQALILKSKELQNGSNDLDALDKLTKILDRLIQGKQRSQKILLEQQRLVPISDIQVFLVWMEELLIRETGDETAFKIINQLKHFKLSEYNGTNH
ncbi:MAG: HGGxSTG domain-containing protein [Balneolales bacterium]